MRKRMSVLDRLALLPIYARKGLQSRGGLAVLREPKKSDLLIMRFTPAALEHMNKLAEATSLLVGFRISQEQLAGLLVEIVLETMSKKELLKLLKKRS